MKSLLFVPGNDEKKLRKALEIRADALIFDWEDSVLPVQKSAARASTRRFLLGYRGQLKQTLLIRFNQAGSEEFQQDCLELGQLPADGIVLSKCRSVEDVQLLNTALNQRDPSGRITIHILIESAAAILNAAAIASTGCRLRSLVFGSEDFCADTGICPTAEEPELLYARSALVTASRAFGLDAIDSPCLELKNEEALRSQVRRARNLGFSGKLAIHPGQVPLINEAFTPAESEIEQARRILKTFSERGIGATTVDGRMIDEPVVKRARQVLKAAETKRESAAGCGNDTPL